MSIDRLIKSTDTETLTHLRGTASASDQGAQRRLIDVKATEQRNSILSALTTEQPTMPLGCYAFNPITGKNYTEAELGAGRSEAADHDLVAIRKGLSQKGITLKAFDL